MNTNQNTEEIETEKIPEWYLSLSKTQKVFLITLRESELETDDILGFFLLLKEDIPAMEDVMLLVYDYKVKGEELAKILTEYIREKLEE